MAKAMFAAASFAHLRAAAGEGMGEPLRIALIDIDEDPNQPRANFDQTDLETLADSIRLRGLLQPIGVHPAQDGRYRLAFGARRYRASKLAGQADIPAIIVPEGQRDFATQVIENQQRAGLSNSELARAVNQLHAEGRPLKEIAAICNLRDYQVSAFRAVDKLPAFLAARLDQGDMRAIYDLFRIWQKTPDAVEAAMPSDETFLTITEARRIIAAITGKAPGSIVLDREQKAEAPIEPEVAAKNPEASRSGKAAKPTLRSALTLPVFIMETATGQRGTLLTSKRAAAKGHALLEIEGIEIEILFSDLRPVDAS
jgi:ParB family chromosome partitioning protein